MSNEITVTLASDWAGIGITAKKEPMAAPEATVSRNGFQRWRSSNGFVSVLHHGLWRKARNV
jgi:hypothetical protein